MPKVINTREQRAKKLREMLARGPSLSIRDARDFFTGETISPEKLAAQYRSWAESWILPEIDFLVPELRKTKGT